ncbi:MAG: hypothetical protein RL209_1640, partial [Pseudomonadota bacterium]
MSDVYPVTADWAKKAFVTASGYEDAYAQSIRDPDTFWREEAKRLDWMTPFTKVKNTSFHEADFGIKWFEDGALNVSANCIDRHLPERKDDIAIIWEGDDPSQQRQVTFGELHAEVCRMANALKALGAQKGDRITIYMPMIPEAAMAMLACTRIGAIHSIVFGGFSPEALAGRIQDCDSNIVITADAGMRGGKLVPLKQNVDAALTHCTSVKACLVVRHVGNDIDMQSARD